MPDFTVDVTVMVEAEGSYYVTADSPEEAEQIVRKKIENNEAPSIHRIASSPDVSLPRNGDLIDNVIED